MDTKTQIQIFKQTTVRWLNNQAADLLGDGIGGKLLRPIAEGMIENYATSPGVDKVLELFINKDGNFNIDALLNRYISILTSEGGIKFKWGDVFPQGVMIDRINGDRINVITAADIKALKDAFLDQIAGK